MTHRLLVALAAAALCLAPAAQASFPGPNGKIAFESVASKNGIGLIAPDGTGFASLGSSSAARQIDPAYSPDGRVVAFAQGLNLWVAPVDGSSPPRQLTTGGLNDQYPAFSPDGTRLAFLRNDSAADIWVIGLDGKGLTNLSKDPAGSDFAPQWSPDGTRIAFTRSGCAPGDESGTCVWVMNAADGGGKVNLTPEDVRAECPDFAAGNSHRRHSLEPTWSPDGKMIAFTGHYDICVNDPAVNSSDIWVMNADGSGKRDLTSADKTVDRQPTWSPDGTRIGFVREPADRSDAELFSIPLLGGAAGQITNNSDPDEDPDWGRTPKALSGRCGNPINGSARGETLNGTPGGDKIAGLGGNDVINGLQGADCLDGGAGNDALSGSEGGDSLLGGIGKDKLSGGLGNDRLNGGAGNDKLDGGQGKNTYVGGAGDDAINSANGKKESVNCGNGRRDSVRADRSDRVKGCERVRRVK